MIQKTTTILIALLLSLGSPAPAAEQGLADKKAAALAAKTVEAMGGRANYDQTRFLRWTFFGRRVHFWDKWTGRVRIEDRKDGLIILMNVHSKEGKVFQNGSEMTDAEQLKEKLNYGYECWINDSYWLVMPYKLRDPGVTLSYAREDQTEAGEAADVLTLTFEGVGVTPENKYEVFVDKQDHLIKQWTFYSNASDPEPRFSTPWADWQSFGKIKLSGNRGKASLDDIAVYDTLPDSVFSDPAEVASEEKADH